MSILSSIGRGFGTTVGRNIANHVMSENLITRKTGDLKCYSEDGWQEGDIDIRYSRDFKKDKVNWILFIFCIPVFIVPVFGLLLSSNFLYKVLIKKHNIYFFDFEWKTFTVSDKRTKTGTKEIKILTKELSRTEEIKAPLESYIQIIVAFLVALVSNIIIFY